MMVRRPRARFATVLGATMLAIAPVIGACGTDKPAADGPAASPSSAQGAKGSPVELLDGGPAAFRRHLATLKGRPVVVNQWASWCGPCKFEFPFFQRLAQKYRGRVAFVGVDSQDDRESALRFLEELPTPYPHFFDRDVSVAREFRGGLAWPTTAFYDARGKRTKTHAGAYATEAKLEEDIRAFALGG